MARKRLRLSLGEVRVTVDLPDSAAPGAAMPREDWLLFSSTELRVLRVLVDRPALSREQIASALDESAEGRLKGVLAALGARKVILVTADGYQLNAPTESRAVLRTWLAGLLGGGAEGESTGRTGTAQGQAFGWIVFRPRKDAMNVEATPILLDVLVIRDSAASAFVAVALADQRLDFNVGHLPFSPAFSFLIALA